jgi:hypothetical protein
MLRFDSRSAHAKPAVVRPPARLRRHAFAEQTATPDQVRVGIDQPRHGPPATQVDDRRPRAAEVLKRLLVGADRKDSTILRGHGGRHRVRRGQGRQLPAMNDEVGMLDSRSL